MPTTAPARFNAVVFMGNLSLVAVQAGEEVANSSARLE
jgi:hypothetical protein